MVEAIAMHWGIHSASGEAVGLLSRDGRVTKGTE